MPRQKNHQCAACSRISDEEAKLRDCWQGQICHSRRTHYRHRRKRNEKRKLMYRLKQQNTTPSVEQPEKIVIAPPIATQPLAVAVVYSPPTGGTHAIAFEVWQDAKLIATVDAVHCTGWTNLDLQAHLTNVIGDLNKRFGITTFATRKTLPATECPIFGCPLNSHLCHER